MSQRAGSARDHWLPALDLPTLPLGNWPTPVARLERLGRHLDVDLWIKRDDLAAEAYGGNKVRKLEFLLAAAKDARARRLLTVGGIGSNQVLATAIHGRRTLDLPTSAVVVPQPLTEAVRQNVRVAREWGVELIPCASRAHLPHALLTAQRRHEKCSVIGPGGSSPLGTVGYLLAAHELRAQIDRGELPKPDDIVVPLGSGGTVAGLWLGLAAAGIKARVVAVRVVERALCNGWLVRLLARRCGWLLAKRGVALPSPRLSSLEVIHDQAGPAYGTPTAAAWRARQLAKEHEGLTLETTYSSKALAAVIARRGQASRGRRVLFWNTYNSTDIPQGPSFAQLSPLPPLIREWFGEAPRAERT